MTTEGFLDDGTMTEDPVQFDLAQEITDSERKKPWQSGHYAKTLLKKSDLRIVLISMEKAAKIKDHHADVDLPPFLRQTVKTQNPTNGELSHGFVTQAVHQGVQAGRRSASGGRGIAS
jgi:hypothetical protein